MTVPNATDEMELLIPQLTTEITTILNEEESLRRARRDSQRNALIQELGTVFTNVDRTRLNLQLDSQNEAEVVVRATFHGRTYRIVRKVTGGILSPFGQEPSAVRYFVELPGGRGVACNSPSDIPTAIVRCHVFAEWRDAQNNP